MTEHNDMTNYFTDWKTPDDDALPPGSYHRAKTHGFRIRMHTRAGRAVLARRRRKGRASLTP